jgi:primary-amine oxidase
MPTHRHSRESGNLTLFNGVQMDNKSSDNKSWIRAFAGMTVWVLGGFLIFISLAFAQDAGPFHPMDALTPDEITATVKLLKDAGDIDDKSRFPAITLLEANKNTIRTWKQGQPFTRAAFVIIRKNGETFEATVDLSSKKVTSFTPKPGAEPMIMDAEWALARDKFIADPRYKAALVKRGITDPKSVFCTPNSAGTFPGDGYDGKRILKVPCFSGADKPAPNFARPIEGLMGIVDSETGEVLDARP